MIWLSVKIVQIGFVIVYREYRKRQASNTPQI